MQKEVNILERFMLPVESISLVKSIASRRKVLIRTKELLSKGWCKSRYHLTVKEQLAGRWNGACPNPNEINFDRYCLMGAVYQAAEDVNYSGSTSVIALMIRQAIGCKTAITHWNDHPDRTKEEVLAVVDKAITVNDCLQFSNS